jgi:uncharacterized protein (TIGR03000 family)
VLLQGLQVLLLLQRSQEMRTISLSLCLLLAGVCTAQEPRVKAAWAWATSKPVSAWAIAPVKLPAQKCSCSPCTCTPCKCDPAKTSDTDAPITLKLTVPNTARVWLQGQEMPGSGSYREFVSPKLPAGKEWVYTIKVRDAYGSEETVEIPLRSGQTRELNFRAPEVPLIETRLPPIQFGQPIPMMSPGIPCGPGG